MPNSDTMPEINDVESDAEFRVRFREWFDSRGDGSETVGFMRGQWVYMLSLIGCHDPGDDFTADDPNPWQPVSRPDARPVYPDPPRTHTNDVTLEDLNRMVVEIGAGASWGNYGTRIPDTPHHREAWDRLVVQIADIRAKGYIVELAKL
jgi:hypothetical protein